MILASQEVTMIPPQDTLTLDALLSDPLTRLVMRSDNVTPEDMAKAFDEARSGLAQCRNPRYARLFAASSAEQNIRWSACR
jgi:hypothetical protein